MKSYINFFWNTKWLLAVTAGILLGLSYPPIPLPFLIFPAFMLVFRLVDLSRSAREAAFWSFLAFIIWNLLTTYWLMMATLPAGIAAIIANSAVMTIPVMIQYNIQKQSLNVGLIALLQSLSWLSYEYLHHQWDLAWPWLTLANAWANVPELIQYISITGYWGISFWLLFSSALAYQAIKSNYRSTAIAAISILLIFPVFSILQLVLQPPTQPTETTEAVIVQPNFDSYHTYGGFPSSREATNHLLQLSDSVRTQDTQLIIWPENSVQNRLSNLSSFSSLSSDTKKLLSNTTEEWKTTIVTGAVYYEFYENDSAPLLPYRSEDGPFLPFNSALSFSPNESSPEIYRKHNLVPIVERVPFVHFLNAIDIFNWIDWSENQQYGKGQEANQFRVGEMSFPALICYDSVYPSWVREFVQQGSGFLTIITNDGWWGNTSGHEQHFSYARLRAIEFDRWVVRSANNGISGIIGAGGAVKVKTAYNTATAFRYEVPVHTSQTLYARFGDWLPIGSLTLLFIGLTYIWLKNRRML